MIELAKGKGARKIKINEMETRSGMERANIRFYEREGLITPKRLDNGYRDYSEEDLQIILRIKLLRSLHVSLEEIKGLKDKSRDLADILSQQIIKLDQEKQDAAYAQDVCRAMQEDRVSFENLDAKKYLDGINQTIKETGSSYFSVNSDKVPQVFHPWRRFFARMLDFSIYGILWSAILAFAFHINLTGRGNWGNLLDSFMAATIMLFLEPLWLHFFATTPGKAILGLRIETPDGPKLSYGKGFARTWGVISAGMGCNIPILNLIRLWQSHKRCSEYEVQPWDEAIAYTFKNRKWQGLLYIGGYAAIFAVLLTIISAQHLPPNRGDLTVAEFVENYNYYANYFGIDYGNEYLDEKGQWAEKNFDGTPYTTYIGIGRREKPRFHFELENEYVTGVSFGVELKNDTGLLGSYDSSMTLVSLAFAGAQNEMGLFSKILKRIAAQINDNSFRNFHFTEAGITFTCDTEYSGYINTRTGILFPEENAGERYFRLNFSMNK